jgi:hypothetical protein
VFRPDDAYLLGIYTHQDWVLEDLVRVIVENWPGAGIFHKLQYAQGTSYHPTEQQRRRDRKLGISGGIVQVDGSLNAKPGQTAAGMPLAATHPVMALGEELRLLRGNLEERLGRVSLFGGPRECGGLAVQGMPSNDSETVLDG